MRRIRVGEALEIRESHARIGAMTRENSWRSAFKPKTANLGAFMTSSSDLP
jgi:hypothetical protein